MDEPLAAKVGDYFEIIGTGPLSGEFSAVSGDTLQGGAILSTEYGAFGVTLRLSAAESSNPDAVDDEFSVEPGRSAVWDPLAKTSTWMETSFQSRRCPIQRMGPSPSIESISAAARSIATTRCGLSRQR